MRFYIHCTQSHVTSSKPQTQGIWETRFGASRAQRSVEYPPRLHSVGYRSPRRPRPSCATGRCRACSRRWTSPSRTGSCTAAATSATSSPTQSKSNIQGLAKSRTWRSEVQVRLFQIPFTGMSKKVGLRFRDSASWLPLSNGASSRNLITIFSPSLYITWILQPYTCTWHLIFLFLLPQIRSFPLVQWERGSLGRE